MALPREGKQPSMRAHSTFTDQHGREWQAVIEKETQQSTGPIGANFKAPIYPPQHIVREVPGKLGRVFVDYDRWRRETEAAHTRYNQQLYSYAVGLFGSAASEKMKEKPPELMSAVGDPPFPLDLIRAAQAGNKWVLGIPQPNGQPYPMPDWAAPFRPWFERKAERTREQDSAEYPDVEVEGVPSDTVPGAFPAHTTFGHYILSNGAKVKGKAEAIAAEQALHTPVGAAVDPSWGA